MYTILLFLIGPFYKMSMEEANCGAASPGIYITSAHPSRRLLAFARKPASSSPHLPGGKQIKAEGGSKGDWQSVKREDQAGSVRWTGIACQALAPGETPMRALRASQDLLPRRLCAC